MSWFCTKCGSENEEQESACVVCGSGKVSEIEQSSEVKVPDPAPGAVEPTSAPAQADGGQSAPESVPEAQEPPAPLAAKEPEIQKNAIEFQFVQSPVEELMGRKVNLDFSIFPVVSVGRSPENVFQVPDNSVSRMHAKIILTDGNFMLEDLGSSNGTYVYDGEKFEKTADKVKLEKDHLVKFGENTIVKVTGVQTN